MQLLSLFTAAAVLIAAASTPVSFTASQVSAGSKAFETHCSACHGAHLEGGAGPALTGPNFKTLSTKVKASVSDIFTYMTTNMPLNAPASLSHTEYVDILAFILSKNGYHAGSSALTFGQASASTAAIVKE
ncbi:MAG TPA: cytochrome c [Alphaproteobacteria bacterium]|nr:cytochrome c [Alphaproteobacteria bacterium]